MLSADGIPFDYILDVFNRFNEVEVTFCIIGKESKELYNLGHLQYKDVPYWAGRCDLKNGFERATANALFYAPFYGGKSLSERWSEIHFVTIGMMPPEDFIRANEQAFPIQDYISAAESGQSLERQRYETFERGKFEKILDIYHGLCQKTGEKITHQLVAEAIRNFCSIKRDSNMLQSSHDSGLETLWDEICVQVQIEYSIYWDVYNEYIEQYLEALILKRCNETQRKILWLCTEEGEKWNTNVYYQDIGELLDGNFAAEATISDTVNYVKEAVLEEAGRYSNKRIRDYDENAQILD